MNFDDEYSGPRWTYGLSFRPLATANVPAGWIIFSNRDNPRYAFGTADWPRQLAPAETAAFQLEYIS